MYKCSGQEDYLYKCNGSFFTKDTQVVENCIEPDDRTIVYNLSDEANSESEAGNIAIQRTDELASKKDYEFRQSNHIFYTRKWMNY